MKRSLWLLVALLMCVGVPTNVQALSSDPLQARVDDSAARRFADLWQRTNGKPSGTEIQARYLSGGGQGLEVFTPGRIESAANLAAKIRADPSVYADAVQRCLPWVEGTNAQLRATYLGMAGLWPNRTLPKIAVVVGAGNSGGTAKPGIQVIGLEVICRNSRTRQDFESTMRHFFAHETVHTFQPQVPTSGLDDMLLLGALREGVPDYISKLVTGQVPNHQRYEWAKEREDWVWQQFQEDREIVRKGTNTKGEMNDKAMAAFRRWFMNAGSPPAGWPDELGYWVGMRIAEAFVSASPDQRKAIDELLEAKAPGAILSRSGYNGKGSGR